MIKITIFNDEEIEDFVGGDVGMDADGARVVATLEGALKLPLDHYIVKDDNGKFSTTVQVKE